MRCTRGLKTTIGGLAALATFAFLAIPALAQPLPDCWNITYGALKHRAASAHPPYIIYSESGSISEDERPLMTTNPSVIYRDDGVLRVTDNGFSYLTNSAQPGPPELGPYGDRRSMWLPIEEPQDPALPLIGSVRVRNTAMTCVNEGVELFKQHPTYKLVFHSRFEGRPTLKALWVDTRTSEIWKVIVSGATPLSIGTDASEPLADFEIELAPVGGYVVVNHVTWKLRYHQFWQTTNFFGEYYYTAFEFPKHVPAALFHT